MTSVNLGTVSKKSIQMLGKKKELREGQKMARKRPKREYFSNEI